MTNEELKKRIIEILDEATGSWYEDEDGMFAEGYSAGEGDNRFKAHVADALIAAGLKFDTVVSHTATFDTMQQDRINELEKRIAEAEHRAEVAERAIRIYQTQYGDVRFFNFDVAIKQAEKELAKEHDQ